VPKDPNAESRANVDLAAWTHLLTCAGFSEQAFDGFKDAHRGEGLECFPVDSLRPGTAG
jgi:hypothetical protein